MVLCSMEKHYKGFSSKILFSSEANAFYGEVINTDTHIAFQAETIENIILAMQSAIDRYLQLHWKVIN